MKGLHRNRKTKQEGNETVRRGFSLGASWSAMMGNGCYLSVSIQQLVRNPLGRNASPIPSLPACATQQTACLHTALLCVALRRFCCFLKCQACMHRCRGCIGANRLDFCRGHSGHINAVQCIYIYIEVEKKGFKICRLTATDGYDVMSVFYIFLDLILPH